MFLDLAKRGVDVFEHDALHVASLDELADHGHLVARRELHSESCVRPRSVVFRVFFREERQRLIEMHRADRDSADDPFESILFDPVVLQDLRDPGEGESPANASGRSPSSRSARFALATSRRDDAEDAFIPDLSFSGIGQRAPDILGACPDPRREGNGDQ